MPGINVRKAAWRHSKIPLWAELGLLVMLLISGLRFAAQVRDIWQNSKFTDFVIVSQAAHTLAQRGTLYDIDGLRARPYGAYYNKPPLVGVVLAPLTRFPAQDLARIYVAISLAFYLLTFLLIARMESFQSRSLPFYLFAIAMLLFQPSLDTLSGAQHEFLLVFLFTLSYAAMCRLRPRQIAAGACLGVAALIKLYPLLFLIYFALRRYWHALLGMIGMFVALTLISIAADGWQLQRQFYFDILPNMSGATAWLENQSFFGFFGRFFVNGATVDRSLVTVGPLPATLSKIAGLVTLAISIWTLIRRRNVKHVFTIFIPLALLIAPDAWIHYETVLLLPLGILIGELFKNFNWIQAVGLLVAFTLLAFGNEDSNVMTATCGLIQSYKFCGVFLTWLLALLATRTEAVPAQIPA
jgi:hypothetical protein